MPNKGALRGGRVPTTSVTTRSGSHNTSRVLSDAANSPIMHNSGSSVKFPCVTCSHEVGKFFAIQCDRCFGWVHGATQCSGLAQKVVQVILDNNAKGATYVCTSCRLKNSNEGRGNQSGEIPIQLFETVRGLASTVRELVAEVKELKLRQINFDPATANPAGGNINQESIRSMLREETVEFMEQEKRKQSIIIRGLGDQPAAVQDGFDDVAKEILGPNFSGRVILSEIVPINSNLVRAKILNDTVRKQILTSAKTLLSSTTNSRVFIKRDLTFTQRKLLKARWEARNGRRQEGASISAHGSGQLERTSFVPTRSSDAGSSVYHHSDSGAMAAPQSDLSLSDMSAANISHLNM